MDANVICHDEFHSYESDTLVGDSGKVKRLGWVFQDQHDLCVRPGHGAGCDFLNLKRQAATVNVSLISFGTADRHILPGCEHTGSIARTYDAGRTLAR